MNNAKNIIRTSEWMKVSELSSREHKWVELNGGKSVAGVYQVAEEKDLENIGDKLVHADIGYTGASKSLGQRTYPIRQCANPSSSAATHGAGRYMRETKLDPAKCFVRYLFTELGDENALEREIHKETEKQFGYRFKWKEASQGADGNYSMLIVYAEKLTDDELAAAITYFEEYLGKRLVAEKLGRAWIN